jgi:hypothetical protein
MPKGKLTPPTRRRPDRCYELAAQQRLNLDDVDFETAHAFANLAGVKMPSIPAVNLSPNEGALWMTVKAGSVTTTEPRLRVDVDVLRALLPSWRPDAEGAS